MRCLLALQAALVYVNTLMVQDMHADEESASTLAEAEAALDGLPTISRSAAASRPEDAELHSSASRG